ncbi:2-oxoacid:ferredoxin oxidoreductase subunit alpha [Clostridium polyendosporum]|uniref:2-oxoacid:ferredoxin oxidoreductase subunit alpha n=1 Tax=Clostridium polyendosporum TaxID=69208 RepID=A0A919RZN6_9CLOT|nr:2-oxoacid:acceptor oxidoreductase subunit alpha [Clostridium polyendosporum]GIM29167.1 2-oxoacid:ferredoxin oxidoreductase subunit alpha [Clostridium polyendosporum]
MKYNILIGGSAGQGMDTVGNFIETAIKNSGFYVFSNKDYMSRVRGGHNFIQIRFGDEQILSHDNQIDLMLALDSDTVEIHKESLKDNGIIIVDESIKAEEKRLISFPLIRKAKEIGLSKAFTFVAAGVVLKYFGIGGEFEKLLEKKFPQVLKDKNIQAIKMGYNLIESKYSLVSKNMSDHILINGNTAIALGALAGGLSFYSGYPMTPATSIMTYLSKKQVEAGIVVEQVEDEISAINMAIGASYAGARAMTGSSGGGFALMVEALGLAGITEIPLVVVDSQRPGPATGLPTRTEQSDLSFILTASHGEFPRIVMSIRNAEDAFYKTFKALNLADKYQTVVLLLTDQYIADSNATILKYDLNSLKIERYISSGEHLQSGEEYRRYQITESGISPRLIPGKVKGQIVLIDSDEHTEYSHITESSQVRNEQMEKRMKKLNSIKNELEEPEYFGDEKIDILLVGWGSTYGAFKEAIELLNKDGVKVGALSYGDLLPLPDRKLRKYRDIARKVINVEQNFTGQLGKLITQETGILMDSSILKYDGRQLTAEEIYRRVKKVVD